mgnify:CR=1 FL=1
MKKLMMAGIACALFTSISFPILANDNEDNPNPNETVLNYYQKANYVVYIPQKAAITFDTEVNSIGELKYLEGNLEPDAYVTVSLEKQSPLKDEGVDAIPYTVYSGEEVFESVVYDGQTAIGTSTPLAVHITKEAWEAAAGGDYAATLTFLISYTNPHEGEDNE